MSEAHWLDEREQAAWRGLLRMHAQLTAELGRRLAAESPLSYPDYEVLVALTDQPDSRLRQFELADVLGWEKSRLSHHIARMAARGLVDKVPCDTDRRGAFVAVTAHGRREIQAAAAGHVAAVRELFIDRLRPAQLDAITRAADNVLTSRHNTQ
jgi:DNA-binding MarR family transcriptional regulator